MFIGKKSCLYPLIHLHQSDDKYYQTFTSYSWITSNARWLCIKSIENHQKTESTHFFIFHLFFHQCNDDVPILWHHDHCQILFPPSHIDMALIREEASIMRVMACVMCCPTTLFKFKEGSRMVLEASAYP